MEIDLNLGLAGGCPGSEQKPGAKRGTWKGGCHTMTTPPTPAEEPGKAVTSREPQISSMSGEQEFHSGRHIAALAFWQVLTPKIASFF